MLSSELEDCWHVIQELASAFGGGGVADMRCEMEQISIQIGLLQHAVSNRPTVAHDTGARLRIPEPKAYNGSRDAKESRTSFLILSSTASLRTWKTSRGRFRLRPCI
ncbi:UNVERIFIED_CONTAM: hypothetical protein Sradi_6988800 [Sesamum radiatum]|uniref:Uncharacterized protein n=1 Tax=Sesamum radiatum TaxID=300843 RepID=A0AAW2JDY2_SESRA